MLLLRQACLAGKACFSHGSLSITPISTAVAFAALPLLSQPDRPWPSPQLAASTGAWAASHNGLVRGMHASPAPAASLAAQLSEESSSTLFPDTQPISKSIGFIGAGMMAQTMIRGWVKSGACDPALIHASNKDDAALEPLKQLGVQTYGSAADSNMNLCNACDVVFLGVKPQHMDEVLKYVTPHIRKHHLLVSIAAGIKLSKYEGMLPRSTRVVRLMPNTPICVGQGATAYCLGTHAGADDEALIQRLMGASGSVLAVDEKMMDAVTALSGSGPAFVYMLIEAMADGGVLVGLPRDTALTLAAQTVAGAGAMVLQASGNGTLTHPGVLKDRVASPAGTTMAGLRALEVAGVRGAVIDAIDAAAQRSQQLSN